MRKYLLATALFGSLTASAFAGDAILEKGNEKIKLWCNNGGCFVADYVNMFKTKNKKKLGPGGSTNFKAHLASYKSKGWS